MRKALVLALSILCLVSCKTTRIDKSTETEVAVPITNTRIEYRDRMVHDSIYLHDSVYTYIKGDTVIKYREKTGIKYLTVIDTLVKTDTIKVPVTITKTVTETKVEEVNKLYWWQKSLMYIGLILLITVMVYLILKYKKVLLKCLTMKFW